MAHATRSIDGLVCGIESPWNFRGFFAPNIVEVDHKDRDPSRPEEGPPQVLRELPSADAERQLKALDEASGSHHHSSFDGILPWVGLQ